MTAQPKALTYRLLDAWRGLASLAVVACHATDIGIHSPGLSHVWFLQLGAYGRLGVSIFFVISGFCIANAAISNIERGGTVAAYFQARIRRIYPPYWASVAITLGLSAFASLLVAQGILKTSTLASAGGPHKDFLFYVSTLTLTQMALHQTLAAVVWWTLCYEVAFYIIMGLFLGLVKQGLTARGMLTGLHALTAGMLLLLCVLPDRSLYPLDLWPQFGLGVLVYDLLRHRTAAGARYGMVAVTLCFLPLMFQGHLSTGRLHEQTRLDFAVAFVFAAIMLALYPFDARLMRARPVQVVSGLGVFSYSLYLIHVPVLGIFNQLGKSRHFGLIGFCCWELIAGIVAVFIGWLFYRVFERPFAHRSVRKPRPGSDVPETAVLSAVDATGQTPVVESGPVA